MTDTLTPEERSRRMAEVRSKNTKPEIIVRKILHRLGYRYFLHKKDLPGTPDIVFPSRLAAIFVNGCFWHRHDGCKNARIPKSNEIYWKKKLEGNRLRDQKNYDALNSLGWNLLIVWECEIQDKESLTKKLILFLDKNIRK